MVFSENQTRQLYVVTANSTTAPTAASAIGATQLVHNTVDNQVYFKYKGADNVMRSDLIDIANIVSAKAVKASAMERKLKVETVTLSSSVNGGVPVAGQDYILRITIRQYIGMSDEDIQLKYGLVHAYAGMTASDFYKTLALSLAKNFCRETIPLLKFALTTADSTVDVDAYTKESALTGTYTGVTLTEVEQEWTRGIKPLVPVYFSVVADNITVSGDSVIWGTVVDSVAATTIGNGKLIADLEYFFMGERGDQYRNINWPNSIPTTYLVDPTQTYHLLDINYFYAGKNEDIQKSQKTITLVCSNANVEALTALLTAFKTATGIDPGTVA